MKISLKNKDGSTMFDMFHGGNIEIHDIISDDTFIFDIGDSPTNPSINVTVNGKLIFSNNFDTLKRER